MEAIKSQDWGERVLCVRVNAWDTEWTAFDVIEVVGNAGERLDELMLPKVQSAAEVVALDLLLTQVEKNCGLPIGHIGIEAQIETARGLINVEEDLRGVEAPRDRDPRSRRLQRFHGDALSRRRPPDPESTPATTSLRLHEDPHGRTRQRPAGDRRALREGPRSRRVPRLLHRTQILGFDGKWALHPDQVTILNEVFSPSQEQFDKAWDVLDAYEKATTEGDRKGAVMFGDEMIDEASRKVAIKLVKKGERNRMSRSKA